VNHLPGTPTARARFRALVVALRKDPTLETEACCQRFGVSPTSVTRARREVRRTA
jgi:hypothetical protein